MNSVPIVWNQRDKEKPHEAQGKRKVAPNDTFKALDMGAVETLIVWEDLDILRFEVSQNGVETNQILLLTPAQAEDRAKYFVDQDTGADLEVVEKVLLIEWLASNFKQYGTTLEFITNKSGEGSQFCQGFGGIGGE